jgi:hypothetical protein
MLTSALITWCYNKQVHYGEHENNATEHDSESISFNSWKYKYQFRLISILILSSGLRNFCLS